jgi:hypothetical protein
MIYSLLLQSFGQEDEYRRAIFCILSHHYHSQSTYLDKVILFTDNQKYFEPFLCDLNVIYISLTEEKIKAMRGTIDFLHRMKIAMIEEAFPLTSSNILYVDSDTFFIGSPENKMREISPLTSFMHLREYEFETLREMALPAGEPFRKFHSLITSKKFVDSAGRNMDISPTAFSWNAGAMAFHQSHQSLIKDVYALTDQFYPDTQNHASEQYAFSVILQNHTSIKPLNDVVYHYWYRVKKNIMDGILMTLINLSWLRYDPIQRRNKIMSLTRQLPQLLETSILTLRDNAIQAFHENKFYIGLKFSMRALVSNPFDGKFILDLAYHFKRWMKLSATA